MQKLIGMCGRAGSGKNTVARYINDMLPGRVAEISFAKPLKDFCKLVYDWNDEHVDGSLKEVEDKRYPRPHAKLRGLEHILGFFYRLIFRREYLPRGPHFLTPRYALQRLGTEWGRDCYMGTWMEVCQRRWRFLTHLGKVVIVTDVRFQNEAKAIQADSGIILKTVRPDNAATTATHASELELAKIQGDFTLDNSSTLTALHSKTRDLVLELTSLDDIG